MNAGEKMKQFRDDRINDDDFFPRLDEDLYDKFLSLGEDYFDDPMMRHCYLQIQYCREIKLRAIQARKINEAMQADKYRS